MAVVLSIPDVASRALEAIGAKVSKSPSEAKSARNLPKHAETHGTIHCLSSESLSQLQQAQAQDEGWGSASEEEVSSPSEMKVGLMGRGTNISSSTNSASIRTEIVVDDPDPTCRGFITYSTRAEVPSSPEIWEVGGEL
jgi:hypothetical protein